MAVTTLTLGTTPTVGTKITYPAVAAVASDGATTPKYLAIVAPPQQRGLLFVRIGNEHNSAAKAVTVWSGGDEFMGKGKEIADATLASGAVIDVIVDPSKYVQRSGDYKGYIVIEGASTDVKAAAFFLPYHA